MVLAEIDRDAGGRVGLDGRDDFAIRELWILEHNYPDAEPNRDVRERRFAFLLAIDPHFRPWSGIDIRPASGIDRHARDFSWRDFDRFDCVVAQIRVAEVQVVAPWPENHLILARAARFAVLG